MQTSPTGNEGVIVVAFSVERGYAVDCQQRRRFDIIWLVSEVTTEKVDKPHE